MRAVPRKIWRKLSRTHETFLRDLLTEGECSDEQKRRIEILLHLQANGSIRGIARELGLPPSIVNRTARHYEEGGLDRILNGARKEDDRIPRLLVLLRETGGFTRMQDVADALHMSLPTVSRLIGRTGIQWKRRDQTAKRMKRMKRKESNAT